MMVVDIAAYVEEALNFDFVSEAKNWNKILKNGEVRICHYPKFPPGHQDRLSVVVYDKGIGPFIYPSAHVEAGKDDWKNYKENIFVDDWKVERFNQPSYINTGNKYEPHEIKIKGHLSFLTNHDYKRIVKPLLDRLEEERMNHLIESFGLEFMIDELICE